MKGWFCWQRAVENRGGMWVLGVEGMSYSTVAQLCLQPVTAMTPQRKAGYKYINKGSKHASPILWKDSDPAYMMNDFQPVFLVPSLL